MGQTINNETYLKTLDYNKTAFHINQWDKKLNTPCQNELHDVYESAATISNTILHSGLCFDTCMEQFGINDVEAKVLIFFYQKRHVFLTTENVYEKLAGYISKAKLLRALKRLSLNGYLQKHIEWQTGKKSITAEGIRLAGNLIARVLKQNNF